MEPRLSSLQELSERNSADPYTLSSKLRRKFRAEKKEDRAKQEEETSVRNRYALPEELKLVPEDEVREEASRGWQERRKDWESEEGGKRLRLANDLNDGDDPDETPSLSHTSRMRAKPKASAIGLSGASTTLRRTILANTARKRDPFQAGSSVGAFTRPKVVGVIVRR
jgi:coiled-coil domain-containing protein 130